MNKIKSLALCSALGVALTSGAGWAQQTATDQFQVLITIESTCSIDSPTATDIDFGTVASTATDIQAEGTLSVNCTPGTPWNIALDAGENAGGDISARAMTDGTVQVPYQLYQEAGRTTVWGDTAGTDTLVGEGIGAVEEVTVYGLVPSANFPAGSYSDTVTATVIW